MARSDSTRPGFQRTDAAMARNFGGRRLHDGGRSDELCRRADVERTIEGRDPRRGHASAIHYAPTASDSRSDGLRRRGPTATAAALRE